MVLLMLVVGTVVALLLGLHQLGEAKDRWVGKLATRIWIVNLIGWSRLGAGQSMATLIVVGAIGAILGAAVFVLVYLAVREQVNHNSDTAAETRAVSPSPTLMLRYRRDTLPIDIKPGHNVRVAHLDPAQTQWLIEIENDTPDQMKWPSVPLLDDPPTFIGIHILEMSNYDEKALLNVSFAFEVFFHEPRELAVDVTEDPDSTVYRFEIDPRAFEHRKGIAYQQKDKHLVSGTLAHQISRRVVIPSIRGHDTAQIYLVNKSAYVTRFSYPTKAEAVIVGHPTVVEVDLVRPLSTESDAFPMFWMTPTQYRWP